MSAKLQYQAGMFFKKETSSSAIYTNPSIPASAEAEKVLG